MESNPIRIGITVCVLILAGTVSIEARARGGSSGGYSSGPPPYRSTINGKFTSYSASPDVKDKSEASTWKTTTAGAAAYLIISRLAVPNATCRDEYVDIYSGEVCENYEDFNGTMLGMFQCPMNGFGSIEKYCCGPDDFEYCCYFSDGLVLKVVLPVCAAVLFTLCVLMIVYKKEILAWRWPCKKEEDDTEISDQPSESSPNDKPRSPSPNCDSTRLEQAAVHDDDFTMPPPPPAYPGRQLGGPVTADAACPPPPPPGVINASSSHNLRFSTPPPSYESVESNKLPTIVS